MSNITYSTNNNIATLSFDLVGEKANKLSFSVLKEFNEHLSVIEKDSSLKALVIQSAKESIFIAGADIKEIEALTDQKQTYEAILEADEIFNRLESLKIPTIAYINGACMGGGLEFALCCNYRVASTNEKTKLAFPEVKLGFFPGLGGTQRAPRLIGLINALDLILTGKSIDAKKAYKMGLVDEIFHDGQKAFKLESFVKRAINGTIKHKQIPLFHQVMQKFSFTRDLILKKAYDGVRKKVNSDFKAPYKALEVIEKTYDKALHEGILIEAKAFSQLAISPESKKMIKLFFTFEHLNKDFEKTSQPIQNVAVLGNGVMGKGIIWLFSKFLKEVRIKIRKIEQVQKILKDVSKLYDSSIKRRRLSLNQVDFKLNKISYTQDFNGLANTQFAIEAIVEDEQIKQETYEELERVLNKDAIIATNTSSISINRLAAKIKNKKNFVGVHFFNPVNMMPLVEIIPNEQTSKKTINRVKELLISCGKTPIVVGDCAGFIVNRILLPYINEAGFILQQSSDIKTIDKTLKEFGLPMGPFTLADTVGIDIGYKVATILHDAYKERMEVAPLLQKMHNELKSLGKKSGAGFYVYKGKEVLINEAVLELLDKQRKAISTQQILERSIYIMINEASRCLEENIVTDANIIDFAMITGTGFPPYRGGLLSYANDVGIDHIVHRLEIYEQEVGSRFKPSNLLLKLKEEKKDFNTGEALWKH